ncbi:uncharacterized protein LOC142504799 [Primulina tabacum]|uniref:uncharacterized protein LOC142504799 n=1 Tax=Primulina tabacum TaxID=48773 RepID=UPI003F5A6955
MVGPRYSHMVSSLTVQLLYQTIPLFFLPQRIKSSAGKRRGFRFENKWLREPGLSEVVRESWVNSSSIRVTDKLQYTADNLQRWGRKVSREFREKIDRCKNEIDYLRSKIDQASVQRALELNSELIVLLAHEETFWKQRAKAYWLKDGDMNSKFFHKTATSRRESNKIKKLTDENGNSIEQTDDLCEVVKKYFTELFSPILANSDLVISKVTPVISEAENRDLLSPFKIEEVKSVVLQMNGR